MRPTSWAALLATAVLCGLAGWVVFDVAYGSFVALPPWTGATALVVALVELVQAKVIRDKLKGVPRGRPMHPLVVARWAVLGKASSMSGAVLGGLYTGFFAWTLPHSDKLAAASDDALVAGLTAGAFLLLVLAALWLERSCRTPKPPDDPTED